MRGARKARLLRTIHPEVRRIRQEVIPFADVTGDRAYQYWDFEDGSRMEVRVWPRRRGRRRMTVRVIH